MKKGIIFDMDGTLFDTEKVYQIGWAESAKEFGHIYNPEFHKSACGTNGEDTRNCVRRYYPDIDPEAYIQACRKKVHHLLTISVPEKPGVHEILEFVKDKGLKIALASSSQPNIIANNLKKTNTEQYFEAIVSGSDVEKGKPAPDIFIRAAQLLDLDPSDCYVIEDGKNGVLAGVSAGCTTIMIPDLVKPDQELRRLCAGIYDSLFDLMEAFKQEEI